MSTFSLDNTYQQFDFDSVSVDDLQVISGGSGGFSMSTPGVGGAGWPSGIDNWGSSPFVNPSYEDMARLVNSLG